MRSRVTKTGFPRNCPAVNESYRHGASRVVSIPRASRSFLDERHARDTRLRTRARARARIYIRIRCISLVIVRHSIYRCTGVQWRDRCRLNVIGVTFLSHSRFIAVSCISALFLLLSLSLPALLTRRVVRRAQRTVLRESARLCLPRRREEMERTGGES